MSEHFDDMIRRQLEGHESPVPDGLFDRIKNHPDVSDALFDGAIKSKLQNAQASIPDHFFERINTAAELSELQFDTVIKQQVENAESAVPADMWQRITKEKERRRRPIVFWWIAASILLIGSSLTYLLQHNSLPTSQENSEIKNSIVNGKEENALQEKTSSISPFNQKNTNDFVTQNQQTSDNNKTNDNATKQPTPNNISVVSKREENFSNSSNRKNGKQFSAENNLTAKNLSSFSNRKKRILIDEVQQQNFEAEQSLYNSFNETEAQLATADLDILQLFRSSTKLTPGQLLQANRPKTPVIPCPSTGDFNRNDWYVDIYASPLLLSKNITDKSAGKNAEKGFDSTLHQQISFNAGFTVVKNIGENILLKTGLQYTRINEAFRLTRINERRVITTVSIRTVILAPGDTVYIRDTSRIEQIGKAERRRQNTYTQWDVPLIIGYEFGGKNILLNANAGLIANIHSSYVGDVVADSLQQVMNINNVGGKPLYKTNVGFSLYAGISLVKSVSNRTSFFIEPHARIGLSNTTNSNAWFTQKNTLIGVSFGVRYKFNNSRQRIY